MKDDSVSQDTGNNQSDSEAKVYVALSTLDAGDGTMPEIGDEVDVTVKGTVKSIDGEVACVSPTEVNGQPAPEDESADKEEPGEDLNATRDQLMRKAQASDASY